MGQCNEMKCFFSFAFCTFFKIFHVRLGQKSKSVNFSRVYVCVKAKLTLVSFFLFFYFVHLPLMIICEFFLSFKVMQTLKGPPSDLHFCLHPRTWPGALGSYRRTLPCPRQVLVVFNIIIRIITINNRKHQLNI